MAKKKAATKKAETKKIAAKSTTTKKKVAAKKTAAKETGKETPAAKKKPAKRATRRSKEPVEVRLKATWGVFNQSVKEVASFEYFDRKAAEKKKDALSKSGKSPHFIRLVKKPVEEEEV